MKNNVAVRLLVAAGVLMLLAGLCCWQAAYLDLRSSGFMRHWCGQAHLAVLLQP